MRPAAFVGVFLLLFLTIKCLATTFYQMITVQTAIDKLKEFEHAEKAHKASLHSMGHWGGHTLGRTLKEHELEDAIKKGDGETVEKCVEELKKMDEASQEDSVSISG